MGASRGGEDKSLAKALTAVGREARIDEYSASIRALGGRVATRRWREEVFEVVLEARKRSTPKAQIQVKSTFFKVLWPSQTHLHSFKALSTRTATCIAGTVLNPLLVVPRRHPSAPGLLDRVTTRTAPSSVSVQVVLEVSLTVAISGGLGWGVKMVNVSQPTQS